MFFLAALAAVAFTSCSQDESTPTEVIKNGEIIVRANLAGLESATRSSQHTGYMNAEGTNFKNDMNVDLFLEETGAGTPTYYATSPYFLKSGSTAGSFSFYTTAARETTTHKYWPASGNQLSFYAWYPAGVVSDATVAEANYPELTLTANQGTAEASNGLDLLFGKPAVNPVTRPAEATVTALTFTHSLSKLTVVLQGDGAGLAADDDQLKGATVTVGSTFSPKVKIAPKTGVCAKTGTANQTFTLKAAGNSALTNWAVVAPGETLTGKTITITLANGGVKTYTIPAGDQNADVSTVAGKEYKYTIKLGLYEIQVSSQITPWGEGATVAPGTLYI